MATNDEITRLRVELDEVEGRVKAMSLRLLAIERRRPIESPTPTAAPPTPPRVVIPPAFESAKPVAPLEVAVTQGAETEKAPPLDSVDVKPLTGTSELPSTFVQRLLQERIDAIRQKTREVGWEVSLGTYWLPRIAVVCIAMAVVFFLSLAIERWGAAWMPHLRVATGYAVCAGLLFAAWRSERKYGGFARVLYGGAFAVMYFVTFATHFVSFSRIFERPTISLILLAVVVASWAVAAQVRRSRVIAMLVTVLGHLTVLISTLSLGRPSTFAMAGLVFLGAGSAFFLLRNRWYYVAVLGMAGCYVNDVVILAYGKGTNPYVDFTVSLGILTVFFLLFALSELLAPEDLRRKAVPTWARSLYVTANTAAFYAIGTALMRHFEFSRGNQDVFLAGLAAVLMVLGIAYQRLRAKDPLYNAYFTKASVLFAMALAVRYEGNTLAAWLSLEMLVLLLAARRSGLLVTRLLAHGIGAVAFAWTVSNALSSSPMPYGATGYAGNAIAAGLGVMAFLAAALVYERTDWRVRSPQTWFAARAFPKACWHLDLMADAPPETAKTEKVLGGLLFPYLYAFAGLLVFLAYTYPLVAPGHRLLAIAAFACLLVTAAMALGSRPYGLASLVAAVPAAFAVGTYEVSHRNELSSLPVAAGIGLLGLAALTSERRFFGERESLRAHHTPGAAHLLYAVPAWLTGLFLVHQYAAPHASAALLAAAAVAAGLAAVLNSAALGGISLAYVAWAVGAYAGQVFHDVPAADLGQWRMIGWALIVAPLLLDRYLTLLGRRRAAPAFLGVAGVVVASLGFLTYQHWDVSVHWRDAAVAGAAFFLVAYAWLCRSTTAAVVALALALLATGRLSVNALRGDHLEAGLVSGFALLALFWLMSERLLALLRARVDGALTRLAAVTGIEYDRRPLPYVPVILVTALSLVMLYAIPNLGGANTTFISMGWFGLSAFLFIFSLIARQPIYRYAGLTAVALTVARVFLIDMKEQDPLLRVAAFAVLGLGLLPISYGYFRWMASLRAKREVAEGAVERVEEVL